MKRKLIALGLIFISFSILQHSCKKDEDDPSPFNIFTVQDDMDFGAQFSQEIENNPQDYPLLKESEYPEAYEHIYRIRDSILNTGMVNFDDTFVWEIKIINDSILNAFAVPGGYLYFYTGIIKYLDNEAQFTGVMAHEIAHVAMRHSTNQLTKVYGIQVLLELLLGQNSGLMAEIASGLATGLSSLAFSRDHEYEADEYAVRYLYATSYDARGIAGFFEKMESSPGVPEFLSTHPSPENRIDEIYNTWQELGGKEGHLYVSGYNEFKNSLP